MTVRRSYAILAAIAMMVGACAHRVAGEAGGDVDIGLAAMSGEDWGGPVRGIGGWADVRGSAYAHETPEGTSVSLTIERGVPGAAYGWEVLEGTCGQPGRAIVPAATFPPVTLETSARGDFGYGGVVVTLPTKLQRGRQYFVNVYPSPEQRSTIVACGRLAD
jgi:hypothetical protein